MIEKEEEEEKKLGIERREIKDRIHESNLYSLIANKRIKNGWRATKSR